MSAYLVKHGMYGAGSDPRVCRLIKGVFEKKSLLVQVHRNLGCRQGVGLSDRVAFSGGYSVERPDFTHNHATGVTLWTERTIHSLIQCGGHKIQRHKVYYCVFFCSQANQSWHAHTSFGTGQFSKRETVYRITLISLLSED